MAEQRLYKVTSKATPTQLPRLLKSSTLGKVESQLVSETYEIEVANSIEVADLMASGVKVETVKAAEKATTSGGIG